MNLSCIKTSASKTFPKDKHFACNKCFAQWGVDPGKDVTQAQSEIPNVGRFVPFIKVTLKMYISTCYIYGTTHSNLPFLNCLFVCFVCSIIQEPLIGPHYVNWNLQVSADLKTVFILYTVQF